MDESIKNDVWNLLCEYPECRNSDGLLAVMWLKSQGLTVEPYFYVMSALNSLKSVWRWRRKIQNDWGEFPACKVVGDDRIILAEEYRRWARRKI